MENEFASALSEREARRERMRELGRIGNQRMREGKEAKKREEAKLVTAEQLIAQARAEIGEDRDPTSVELARRYRPEAIARLVNDIHGKDSTAARQAALKLLDITDEPKREDDGDGEIIYRTEALVPETPGQELEEQLLRLGLSPRLAREARLRADVAAREIAEAIAERA